MERDPAMERERQACHQAAMARDPSCPALTIPRLAFGEQLTLWSARRVHASTQCDAATEADAAAGRREVLARVGRELGVALRTVCRGTKITANPEEAGKWAEDVGWSRGCGAILGR